MYFGRKDVETEPSYSHEVAIFIKHHMLLRACDIPKISKFY